MPRVENITSYNIILYATQIVLYNLLEFSDIIYSLSIRHGVSLSVQKLFPQWSRSHIPGPPWGWTMKINNTNKMHVFKNEWSSLNIIIIVSGWGYQPLWILRNRRASWHGRCIPGIRPWTPPGSRLDHCHLRLPNLRFLCLYDNDKNNKSFKLSY